ncbi:hypothetical protein T440DRAFT_225115 [Plenodomus tracheiphilus IPT5]|uniref:Uncharacterized protein n=1 Tax=Plenodomus tracheiphilus IPT5 TaxID=1408161 RepID=A0A6A7AUB9_9PLEO|nr:hypothetical protein T440DRAFT_225115 [Plenodomus tracheiphilus IPT5]
MTIRCMAFTRGSATKARRGSANAGPRAGKASMCCFARIRRPGWQPSQDQGALALRDNGGRRKASESHPARIPFTREGCHLGAVSGGPARLAVCAERDLISKTRGNCWPVARHGVGRWRRGVGGDSRVECPRQVRTYHSRPAANAAPRSPSTRGSAPPRNGQPGETGALHPTLPSLRRAHTHTHTHTCPKKKPLRRGGGQPRTHGLPPPSHGPTPSPPTQGGRTTGNASSLPSASSSASPGSRALCQGLGWRCPRRLAGHAQDAQKFPLSTHWRSGTHQFPHPCAWPDAKRGLCLKTINNGKMSMEGPHCHGRAAFVPPACCSWRAEHCEMGG